MLNSSFQYIDHHLHCDSIAVTDIVRETGTPVYLYSLRRLRDNLNRIRTTFVDAGLNAHIHYSAKANANLSILRTLIEAGAGIDAVSGGEIHRAFVAGAKPEQIVFAGVGKTPDELCEAVQKGVGWINVENVDECRLLNDYAAEHGRHVNVALRLNPEVTASTHPYIATGHGGAKFGLTAEVIAHLLAHQSDYPQLNFAGIHVHIGSQLHDTAATRQAIEAALTLIRRYPNIRTVNIGGGLPVAYKPDESLPDMGEFARLLRPLLKDYVVLLEPGRSVVADAGILVTRVLYVKQQAGQTFYITDASMTELIRPALYQAHHEIVPVIQKAASSRPVTVVGPVCETADVLGREVQLPDRQPGDLLAILTTGAYGMVMASNYNARLRPLEAAVDISGESWSVIRRRETWDDLLHLEQ